jgi:soluble cytochrome b562
MREALREQRQAMKEAQQAGVTGEGLTEMRAHLQAIEKAARESSVE